MHENIKKERFSLAYTSAVAAHAGFQVVEPRVDDDSVDGILMGSEGGRPRIEFQAKATAQDVLKDDHLAFSISIKNYDDLRADVIVPRILIVVRVPKNEADWIVHSEEKLLLRYCGYWMSLQGMQERDTKNVTVQLPRAQTFDSVQLATIMDRMQTGQEL